ncbi:hypothetical protein [Vibrio sp. CAU 1672]|uniref:hypothetical protein n=1 Tax=Vibrio sp. CAU 1672 TaxID=3032594 RepID=UPI0023DB0167|nr:hypothetical protein [Vibrio sp. CAU 1672]MDF2154112.1 hypothetical protein [Vibrio sp. CAU 1672]
MVRTPALGHWQISLGGEIINGCRSLKLKRADLSVVACKLSLHLHNQELITIWRDSCPETDYRRLVLLLRQWQDKQMGA